METYQRFEHNICKILFAELVAEKKSDKINGNVYLNKTEYLPKVPVSY